MTGDSGSQDVNDFSGWCDVLDEAFGFGENNVMYPKINNNLIYMTFL